jgi:N6-adenosine-specific RNA methylase IME4
MGFTTRKNAEDCLLFRTGRPQRLARDVPEVIISPVREHSRKPEEAFARIERFCPGPRVELFAREHREGWDAWGEEAGLFNDPALNSTDQPFASAQTKPSQDHTDFGMMLFGS